MLDVSKRTLRAIDPLSLSEHKKTLHEINRIVKSWIGEKGPYENTLKKGLKDGQIKSCLWEMSEMIRAGTAALIYGTIPAPDKIMERNGRLRTRSTFNLEGQTVEATEDEEKQILESVLDS